MIRGSNASFYFYKNKEELNMFVFEDMIIDRVLEIVFRNSQGEVLGGLNQISDFSINQSSETKDKTDAQGVLIRRFFTAKTVEVSGTSALPSLSLLALANGTQKDIATTEKPLVLPSIEKYAASASPVTLKYEPVGTVSVCGLTASGVPDPTLNYTLAEEAGEGKFAISGKVVTLPTNASGNVQITYNYSATSAVAVTDKSNGFPKTCEMLVKALVCEACDKENMRLAYVSFPAYQMSPDMDWTVDTESGLGFSGAAQVDYCGGEQSLFTVSVSEDDIEE